MQKKFPTLKQDSETFSKPTDLSASFTSDTQHHVVTCSLLPSWHLKAQSIAPANTEYFLILI